jgi:CopG family nickel-responsive transcriptional regulator
MTKDSLVRFGVAMEGSLLREFDALVADRGGTRSEVLRDLVRAEVGRARVRAGANAVAALTLVYDHHVRDLTERLTDFQHALGEKVVSTLHVHLDHDHCLEVVVMRGPSEELQSASGKLLATRGVKHGGLEVIAIGPAAKERTAGKRRGGAAHDHHHDHEHERRGRRRRATGEKA